MTPYLTSDCAVELVVVPLRRQVNVRVVGDLDTDAKPVLSDAIARIAALAPEHVFVDLDEAGFAGSTLHHFLAKLVDLLPHPMSVTVCRPRPMHRWVLDVSGMEQILRISTMPIAGHGDDRELR